MPKQRLADKAYFAILRQITRRSLVPGARLTELQLSKMLKMSRTPVREAINRLSVEGILVSTLQRGIAVRHLSHRDIGDLYEIREALESKAAREAALHAEPRDVADLGMICQSMAELTAAPPAQPVDALQDLELKFRLALIKASHSDGLIDLYQRQHFLKLQALGLMSNGYALYLLTEQLVTTIVDSQRQLVASICQGDPSAAEQKLRHHTRLAAATHRAWLSEQVP